MSHHVGTAISVEARKAMAAKVMIWITVILIVGIAALTLAMLLGAASGDAQIVAKLGTLTHLKGWSLLVGIVTQITATGGLLAFGVALSWLFGREFADGTVTGLFALPVRRGTIAIAKLTVFFGWAVGIAVLLTSAVAIVGIAFGYGAADISGIRDLVRIPALVMLTALISVPAAWAATLGRGLLPGIAGTVGLVVIGQFMAVIGIGAWVPIVAPALWAIDPDAVPTAALLTVPSVPLVFGALSIHAWSRLQLDR